MKSAKEGPASNLSLKVVVGLRVDGLEEEEEEDMADAAERSEVVA